MNPSSDTARWAWLVVILLLGSCGPSLPTPSCSVADVEPLSFEMNSVIPDQPVRIPLELTGDWTTATSNETLGFVRVGGNRFLAIRTIRQLPPDEFAAHKFERWREEGATVRFLGLSGDSLPLMPNVPTYGPGKARFIAPRFIVDSLGTLHGFWAESGPASSDSRRQTELWHAQYDPDISAWLEPQLILRRTNLLWNGNDPHPPQIVGSEIWLSLTTDDGPQGQLRSFIELLRFDEDVRAHEKFGVLGGYSAAIPSDDRVLLVYIGASDSVSGNSVFWTETQPDGSFGPSRLLIDATGGPITDVHLAPGPNGSTTLMTLETDGNLFEPKRVRWLRKASGTDEWCAVGMLNFPSALRGIHTVRFAVREDSAVIDIWNRWEERDDALPLPPRVVRMTWTTTGEVTARELFPGDWVEGLGFGQGDSGVAALVVEYPDGGLDPTSPPTYPIYGVRLADIPDGDG